MDSKLKLRKGSSPRKILIIRVGALGDIIFLLPSLSLLRRSFPEAEIHYVVKKGLRGILEGHPAIDRLWSLDSGLGGIWRLSRELRREGFDLVLDYHGNLRSGLIGRFSGAPDRVGFAPPYSKEGNKFFTNHHVTPPGGRLSHRVERHLALTRALPGVPLDGPCPAELSCEPEAEARAQQLIAEQSPGSGPLVIIHSGTSARGAIKRWAEGNYADLARRLIEAQGARVMLLWGSGEEREEAERIHGMIGSDAAFVIDRRLSFTELFGAFKAAALIIGVDTGPVHLANTFGRPVLALFGPKSPEIYRPYQPGAEVINANAKVGCPPCDSAHCRNPKGRICMEGLSVEDVFAVAERQLKASAALEKSS